MSLKKCSFSLQVHFHNNLPTSVATSPKYYNTILPIAGQCTMQRADNHPKLINYKRIFPVSNYTTSFPTSTTVNGTINITWKILSDPLLAHRVNILYADLSHVN